MLSAKTLALRAAAAIVMGCLIVVLLVAFTGCAVGTYGDGIVHDRYGDAWERCHVGRHGRSAWCRVE